MNPDVFTEELRRSIGSPSDGGPYVEIVCKSYGFTDRAEVKFRAIADLAFCRIQTAITELQEEEKENESN